MLRLAFTIVALVALVLPAQSQQGPSEDRSRSRSVDTEPRRRVDDTSRRAELIDADDTNVILDIARSVGSASLDRGDRKDPAINGEIKGLKYSVLFSACTNGRNCKYIQLIASFVLPKGFGERDMNDWNKTRLFGKAFVNDKGDAVISLNVTLVGGVSRANINDTFTQFRIFLNEFNDFLYGKKRR